jgi:NHLM bacteriocin system ABC transporter peptidase/ATP-binding protein
MEAAECGAASLGMILAYHGRFEPLEKLRLACGVSRDGSNAGNVVRAARHFGLEARGFAMGPAELRDLAAPFVVFWEFNHFLVVEGHGRKGWWVNDPASGPRLVSDRDFDTSYTGVVLTFKPGPDFAPGGTGPSLLRSLARRARGLGGPLAVAAATGFALAVLGLVLPSLTRVFVDEILVGGHRSWTTPLLWIMGTAIAMLLALTALQQRTLYRLQAKLSLTSSSRFLSHLLRLPMDYFGQRFGGEVGARVAINDRVAQLLSGQLATNVLGALMAVLYLLVLAQFDVVLTAVVAALAAASLLVLAAVSRRRRDLGKRVLQEQGKLLGVTLNGLQIIETLKANGSESAFFSRWSGQHARASNSGQELAAATQVLNAVPALLTTLNTAVVLGVGGLRVMQQQLTLGELVAFQALVAAFLLPVGTLVALGSQLQQVDGDLTRLDDVLENPVDPQWYGPEVPALEAADATGPPKLSGRLELRDVTFGYSPLAEPLIKDLSLTVRPGGRVALVGASGSGKSTVAKLVAGLHRPWSGEILFDGKPRTARPREVLAASVASVDQEIFLFEGTFRENLTLWDGTVPDSDVVDAARDACVHDVVTARAGGYGGAVEEGGRNLSGGQRQRLEIARALHANPSLLILDEATSALDPLTEKQIDDALRRRGCSCLIIAHRLSTIRDCDEIVVLERGRVVERGTHDELVLAGGAYSRLIQDA